MVLSLYDVLRVQPGASPEEIKAAYHALVLQLHPDKQAGAAEAPQQAGAAAASQQQFHQVQRAWEVLREPQLRDVHDRELAQAQMHDVVTYQDELDVDDMDVGEDAQGCRGHTYECRCGDVYWLPQHEVQAVQSSIAIPCRSCSNHILVRVKADRAMHKAAVP